MAHKKEFSSCETENWVKHAELKGLFLISISFLLLLALISFRMEDIHGNWLGLIGYSFAYGLYYTLGVVSYLALLFASWSGFQLIKAKSIAEFKFKAIYFTLFSFSASILINILYFYYPEAFNPLASFVYTQKIPIYRVSSSPFLTEIYPGGFITSYLLTDIPYVNFQYLFSLMGTTIIFSILLVISGAFLFEVPISNWWMKEPKEEKTFSFSFSWFTRFYQKVREKVDRLSFFKKPSSCLPIASLSVPTEKQTFLHPPKMEYIASPFPPVADTPLDLPGQEEDSTLPTHPSYPPSKEPMKLSGLKIARVYEYPSYKLPSPHLFTSPKPHNASDLQKLLKDQASILEETLQSFGIEAKVGQIHLGPSVISFEVHPSVGVKVQKIKTLENDIALNLKAKSIRIIAPIPGKAAVGIEIPNPEPQEVGFKELLSSYQKNSISHHIPLLLGKTVTGQHVFTDLAKMPHCIIAGATGSGKSVCINTIIMSIIMNAKPDDIKLILVDPKKVELSTYTHLPHMIAPVITEPDEAQAALLWLVREMEMRYELLKHMGLRNIHAFNQRKINRKFESSLGLDVPEKLFYIVCIIDELADLMMSSSSDIELPITRIAQMARAVGIHLILATQRPSREVITGIIKANFPARIAFKVASRINSQIIIDETGAETLLGNGDMLFLPPGTSNIVRVQGCFCSDEDIQKVMAAIQKQAPSNYLIRSFRQAMNEVSKDASNTEEPKDKLFEEAKQIVLQSQIASTTFLQRKLKIGYARAASLVDELEAHGLIGPAEGSKPRKILFNASHEPTDD